MSTREQNVFSFRFSEDVSPGPVQPFEMYVNEKTTQ